MTETSVDPSSFSPFEVTAVHLVYVGLGFFIVLFGMFSLFIKEKLYLGEAPLAAVFGIIVGPAALNLFNPSKWANNESGAPGGKITDEISLEVLRVTIALSVFAVGVELPKKYLLRHWRSIAFLLGPVMIWGWLITALFMYALVPGLDFLNSLVVASCVTPTDPILAQAVVGGPWAEKHVPAHLRHILMCESGCNDGAAFPFLYLALFLTLHRDNRGKAIAEWFYDALAYQIIFGTLLGALIGWAARKLMRFSERHKLVDRESFVAQYVSLAIASMGVNVLLGSDDLLAAFACGTAFAWDGWFTKQTEDSNFSSIVDLLFNVAVFIYIGAMMPFRDWAGGTEAEPNTLNLWRLFVLAICVLLTKRIPIVLGLWKWIPDIKTFREAVFAGHFGPIGVGAIFIATLARTELPDEIPSPPETSNDVLALVVQPIIYFFVICSITIHGLTIPFFAFSKNATRMTRTWSRNPSFARFDTEPGWVSRMRKRTGENLKEEEGGMSEIERVLNAQLRQIGKGAIGGEDEKEFARIETNGGSGSGSMQPTSSSSSGADAATPRARVQFDGDYIDEEGHEDVLGDEWGGDDTIEMRRYQEKQKAKKEMEYAKLRQLQQEHDEDSQKSQDAKQHDSERGDLGGANMMDEERGAMDRDIPRTSSEKRHEAEEEEEEDQKDSEKRNKEKGYLSHLQPHHLQSSASSSSSTKQEREHAKIREECEEHYPKSRSWTEGDVLIIEYQKSKLSEVECHKIPIFDHEKDDIIGKDDPAHAWAIQHADGLQYYAGLEDANNWSPSEAINHLVMNKIPKKYSEIITRRKRRRNSDTESKEQQDARFNALYGGITYASERRNDADENDYKRVYGENDGRIGVQRNPKASSGKKPIKQHRERTPSPPVTGWLAPRSEDIARQKLLKASRRRGGRTTSPKGSLSPPGSASPTGFGDAFGLRQGPKEYKCSSEARRRNMKKKLMAGKISLCPHEAEEEEANEEIFDSPASFSGLGIPRTSSAGGLGQSSSSQSSGKRSMFGSNSSSNALLSIPRTFTSSSQDSSSNNRSASQFVPSIRSNHDHSRSSSVQWLDINDDRHDHRSSRRSALSGMDHPSIPRSSSPNRMGKIDLARIGGGISRPSSGQGHRSGADTPNDSNNEKGDDDQSVYASSSISKQTQKRRSRFGTLLSSIASGGSPSNAFDRGRQQSPQQSDFSSRPSTAPMMTTTTTGSNEGNALAPSSPAIIVGAGEYPGGDGGGGILADGNASTYSGHNSNSGGTETPKRQPPQQQQNTDSPAGNERGVTFEF